MTASKNATSQIGNIIRVSSGNFLEMYDFMIFGYYAPNISHAFFPTGNAFVSLMLALMTFGAGFLMRPVGAVVLGAYTDHHGRRKGLILTLALMAVGTLSLACTPSYGTIGILAPTFVVIGRLVQGFSAGAELGTVSVYLSEIAPSGRKGFFTSWQSASQQIAVVFAAVMGLWLTTRLTSIQMEAWGWRVPLAIGCALIPFLYLLRRTLKETDEYNQRTERPPFLRLFTLMLQSWPVILAGMLMVAMTTVTFYLITAYTPTFGRAVLNLSSSDSFIVTLCVGFSNFVWLIVMGALSDRIGRRPLLIGVTILTVLTAYPAMQWLVTAPSFDRLLLVELWLSFSFGSYNGAMVPYLTEVIPIEVRAAGFSIAYSLATAIFGGFTPAICTYLIYLSGDRAIPGAWVSLASLLGLVGVLLLGRMRWSSMRSAGTERPSMI